MNAILLKSISINNQKCIVIPGRVNINSNEPTFYPYSIEVNKCSCNNISNPYAKLCVPDIAKYVNVKVFSLMSRTNEIRHIRWYEICKYKWGLDASVCNNKQW